MDPLDLVKPLLRAAEDPLHWLHDAATNPNRNRGLNRPEGDDIPF